MFLIDAAVEDLHYRMFQRFADRCKDSGAFPSGGRFGNNRRISSDKTCLSSHVQKVLGLYPTEE
jgi:hypothetical protein